MSILLLTAIGFFVGLTGLITSDPAAEHEISSFYRIQALNKQIWFLTFSNNILAFCSVGWLPLDCNLSPFSLAFFIVGWLPVLQALAFLTAGWLPTTGFEFLAFLRVGWLPLSDQIFLALHTVGWLPFTFTIALAFCTVGWLPINFQHFLAFFIVGWLPSIQAIAHLTVRWLPIAILALLALICVGWLPLFLAFFTEGWLPFDFAIFLAHYTVGWLTLTTVAVIYSALYWTYECITLTRQLFLAEYTLRDQTVLVPYLIAFFPFSVLAYFAVGWLPSIWLQFLAPSSL